MDSQGTRIDVHRTWRSGQFVMLLGPGGVGKSTLGRELSARLGWRCVDLDLEFCDRIGLIGPFIGAHGYERYRAENLALAAALLAGLDGPSVLVTSSGFLAAEPGTCDHREARRLAGAGYGIALLPSLDVDIATPVVVERQLQRGFGLDRPTEERKFRERFPIYRDAGDMLVVSNEPPGRIAAAVAARLS